MIDIHCHLLYGVDDGADTINTSLTMLNDAVSQGITDIILTPHYRKGMFPFDKNAIMANYESIRKTAADMGIRLYLGCEYHANADMVGNLRNDRVMTLAGSDHVLAEYSHNSTLLQIQNSLDELLSNGYIPVIAHAERYGIVEKDPAVLALFEQMGALVQINANAILGLDGSAMKRVCKKILKGELADIIASDSHDMRERRSHMQDCRRYVSKKYGETTAVKLFERNPRKIIEGINRTGE
ncbi:MAG: hypothetical protein K6F54_08675 [Lachnospiraceae bacterium]|nr:hypothetical protein [Lachnospiraceae bacterium]